MSVYLDYNASAPIHERVLEVMINSYKNNYGNADSRTNIFGENARSAVESARKQVASLLAVSSGEVFFTSGATESNNIAIQGLSEYAEKTNKRHIVTTSIEHKAVLETVKHMQKKGFEVDFVSPDKSGRISADELLAFVREDTLLVSVMHVNNETGIIQPVKEIGEALKERNVFFHVDATQSCGKLVEEIRSLSYDMLSFSAHKLMGPQGIGCLILRKKGYRLPPVKNILFGGQQEHGIRPGTMPVALIVGCGEACELAEKNYHDNNVITTKIKECILNELEKSGVKYSIIGLQKYCVSSTLSISFEGVMSEALMLSSKKYCGISNGSACTSKSYSPSYVLVAMGIPEGEIESTVRLSWGSNSDEESIRNNIRDLLGVVKSMSC